MHVKVLLGLCATMAKIDHVEFLLWSRYIHELTGIQIEPTKTYLVESRLGGLMAEHGCKTFADLYRKAKADVKKTIERKVIDLITTNETCFFRDTAPFEMLKYKIIPELIDKRAASSKRGWPTAIRIWSAGCSTGQEVYSIAIALKELLRDLNSYRIKVLGTDISGDALNRASRGIYSALEVQRGLSCKQLAEHFVQEGDCWRIKDEIRAMVFFKRMSLLDPFSSLGSYDIVFCRNVSIYFKLEDRRNLFDKIADVLEPDGYLIIGSTESLTGIHPQFQPKRHLRSIFYQLSTH